jgi:hypothetical protein
MGITFGEHVFMGMHSWLLAPTLPEVIIALALPEKALKSEITGSTFEHSMKFDIGSNFPGTGSRTPVQFF